MTRFIEDLGIERLFSADVKSACLRPSELDDDTLSPLEQVMLGDVAPQRRRDFVAGRRCASRCMELLGHAPAPVLIGPQREPVWPPGLIGSITHTEGLAAAAVARVSSVRGIGIDAERNLPLPPRILELIATAAEREWAARIDPSMISNPGCLLFCVKEATYKVWYPLTRRWLGFEDVTVEFNIESESFVVAILERGPIQQLFGRYSIAEGLVVAAIELENVEIQGRGSAVATG